MNTNTKSQSNCRPLSYILDIPLEFSVELGRTRLLVGELMQLGQGSVIELDKLAGGNLEALVGDKVMAKGESVIRDGQYAIKITEIISPEMRIRQLS